MRVKTLSAEASQLVFVDLPLGRALDPEMTPETILIDNQNDGKVLWSREGALDDASLKQGLKALREFK